MHNRLVTALTILPLCVTLAACGDDVAGSATGPTGASRPTQTATPIEGAGSCTYAADGQTGPAAKPVDLPPAEPRGLDRLTIRTSQGEITVSLASETAPCTVNSFVSLAAQGYFDDTVCHRLTTAQSGIYVLQCGDPTATGSGGPGYRFANEVKPSDTFSAGTLAMAHSSLPDSNGSQFFLVYQDTPLPPDYTVFGRTADADSLAVLQAIGEKGTADGAPDGTPKDEVRIRSVR